MRETIYWQCQGSSIWEISDDAVWPEPPRVVETHELSPGDVIYLPRELKHNVIIRAPRCGIAYAHRPDRSEIHTANDMYVKKEIAARQGQVD
jgi:ribosomal protein L16 Arg81 hydroxylase